jgi:hypothetical protein
MPNSLPGAGRPLLTRFRMSPASDWLQVTCGRGPTGISESPLTSSMASSKSHNTDFFWQRPAGWWALAKSEGPFPATMGKISVAGFHASG